MKKLFAFLIWATLSISTAYAADNYEQLSKLFQDKQYDSLETICQTRLKKNPKSLDSYYFLAMMRMASKKADEAVPYMLNFAKYHEEAEKLQGQKEGTAYILVDAYYIDLYYLLGEYYVRKSQFEKALPWLTKAKSRYIDDAMLQFFLGLSYGGAGDYENAVKAFKKEMELDPKDPSPFYNLACCYAKQGREKDALQWLQKAIAAYPQYKQEAQKDDSFKKIKDSKGFKAIISK